MNKITIQRPLWLIVPCVAALILIFAYHFGIRVGLTASLPFYLFRVVALTSTEEITRQCHVAFKPVQISHGIIPVAIYRRYITSRTTMVKRVAAIPGDTVLLKDGHIFINGISKPLTVLSEDSQQRSLFPYPTPLTLGENFYWLTSCPELGFDSRYFGPIHRSIMLFRAYPIF